MIRTIRQSEFKKMPWKNGKGTTQQIYIHPENSNLDKNNFDLRISSAPIATDGEFSQFAGMSRILVPIKGAGFELNGKVYEKFEVANFSGDELTSCRLIKDSVMDVGVIYDPKKFHIHAKVLNIKSPMSFDLDPNEEYFITVLSGGLNLNDEVFNELETIHYKNESSCSLISNKSVILLFLRCVPR